MVFATVWLNSPVNTNAMSVEVRQTVRLFDQDAGFSRYCHLSCIFSTFLFVVAWQLVSLVDTVLNFLNLNFVC